MTRILIADDHPVVRSGVRRIIESMRVGLSSLRLLTAKTPLPRPSPSSLTWPSSPMRSRVSGIEATRQIRQRAPSVEVLIFTMHDNEDLLRQSFNAGARGYVLKSDAQQQLISAVQAVAEHRPFFTDRASQVLLENF